MQTEDSVLRLDAWATELIHADAEYIANSGLAEFCVVCEGVIDNLRRSKPRVGRGALMVELGLRVNEIREHPERFQKNLSGGESCSDRSSSKVIGIGTRLDSASNQVTDSLPTQKLLHPNPMGALPVTDADDEPW